MSSDRSRELAAIRPTATPVSAEDRFVAVARRSARKGTALQWPQPQASGGGVPRSSWVKRSPRAARKQVGR